AARRLPTNLLQLSAVLLLASAAVGRAAVPHRVLGLAVAQPVVRAGGRASLADRTLRPPGCVAAVRAVPRHVAAVLRDDHAGADRVSGPAGSDRLPATPRPRPGLRIGTVPERAVLQADPGSGSRPTPRGERSLACGRRSRGRSGASAR